MKAKIVPNLLEVIEDYFGVGEGHKNDLKFLELCNRIAGQEVELVFTLGDAFEAIDNNYWLPNCCWEETDA